MEIELPEPAGFSVYDKRRKAHWYAHNSRTTAQHQANFYSHQEPDGTPSMVVVPIFSETQMRQAIAAAVAKEREACAKVCDEADKSTHPSDLASAIRARGETPCN